MDDAHCMHCKKIWSLEFIDDNFDKKFITKDLVRHRESVLIDREKALLPATQPLVELEIEKRKTKQYLAELVQQKRELDALISHSTERIRRLNRGEIDLQNEDGEDGGGEDAESIIARSKRETSCPNTDCRGFLNAKFECGLCECQVCRHCECIVTGEKNTHVCDPDTVATVKLLKKECKKCPSCPAVIFKVDGCSQMFCTKCHCVFNYNTGVIQNSGVIHNPEYYRWMRDNGNEMPAGPVEMNNCDNNGNYNFRLQRPPYLRTVNGIRGSRRDGRGLWRDYLMNVHRMIGHISDVEVRRLDNHDIVRANENLRIKYLMNELSETQFKTMLQRQEKNSRKMRCYKDLLQLVVNVITDAFESFNESKDCDVFENTVKKIVSYSVGQCDKINDRFQANISTYKRLIQDIHT